jgi:16S rRNA processing protein RimM
MQQTLGSFFIESSFAQKRFLRIRFEDMNTEEEADALLATTYIFPKYVAKLTGNKFYFTK